MPNNQRQNPHRNEMVISYNRVRNALGVLGVSMPLMLIFGGMAIDAGVQPTLSDYYHTTLRDVFVGSLCAMGVFLISYRGYRKEKGEWFSDDLIATIAGLSAFGVALFPNINRTGSGNTTLPFELSPVFHFGSAMLFYLCMSLFCYIKFTKNAKPGRRRIYRACGHAIWASGISIAVFSYLKNNGSQNVQDIVDGYNVVFWVEAIGIWAFALSWLVKGKADMILMRQS